MAGSRDFDRFVFPNQTPGVAHPFHQLPTELVAQIGIDGQAGIQYYFNHFNRWEGPNAAASAGGFTVTAAGVAAIAVRNGVEDFGVLRCAAAGVAGNNINIQMDGEPWRYVAGKRMWCFARIATNDANASDMFFGLGTEHTDFVNAEPADGIFFEKATTGLDFNFHVRQDTTSTSDLLFTGGTLADDTFWTLGFQVTDTGDIIPWFDTGSGLTAGTTVPGSDANIPSATADVLSLFWGVETGAVAASSIDIDWIFVAVER